MKFLADVNIPQSVITSLNDLGYDTLDIKTINVVAEDTELIKLAKQEERIILTKDKDFIVLTQFPKHQVPIIVIRLKNQTPKYMLEKLTKLLINQKSSTLKKSLTILKEELAESHLY